ncbi:MAG: ferredoxin [Chloroflexi bacterium]|nr:ferredoxin [Chloroflexota bacterium]MBU1750680.1 ferredoxin [Chloroflexota bacterium]
MSVKIHIDRDECIRCGSCRLLCEQFFEENPDDGFSQIVARYRVGDDPGQGAAPDELQDCVQEATDACPVGIIHIQGA